MPALQKAKVVVIGELFVDHIFSEFNSFPKLGEESFARRYHKEVGGGAAITACALAKLGVEVAVIGAVGRSDGRWVFHRLASYGVDCSGLQFEPAEPTGVTMSASTREERAFFTYYGANHRLVSMLQNRETSRLLAGVRHVHFACALDSETEGPLQSAIRRKARTSIDVQSHMSWLTRPESLQILRCCDIFFPNEREAGWISSAVEPHDILHKLHERGLKGVGLKLGGKGAALLWHGRQFLTDPYPVETLDTTGAGDCFNAGFIYAWLRGDSPPRCLEVANICGALSTRALGGIAGFPTRDELQECELQLEQK
jgi:sugar/nucleoside kinase (ribokinase family)